MKLKTRYTSIIRKTLLDDISNKNSNFDSLNAHHKNEFLFNGIDANLPAIIFKINGL